MSHTYFNFHLERSLCLSSEQGILACLQCIPTSFLASTAGWVKPQSPQSPRSLYHGAGVAVTFINHLYQGAPDIERFQLLHLLPLLPPPEELLDAGDSRSSVNARESSAESPSPGTARGSQKSALGTPTHSPWVWHRHQHHPDCKITDWFFSILAYNKNSMQDSGISSDARFYSPSVEQTSAAAKFTCYFIFILHPYWGSKILKWKRKKSLPEQKFLNFKKPLRI